MFYLLVRFGRVSRGCGHETLDTLQPSENGSKRYWGFGERVLPIKERVAQIWGRLNCRDVLPIVDSLLAATAHAHRLSLVTRNVKDIERTGVRCVNPFERAGSIN